MKRIRFFERPQGLYTRPIINSFNKYFLSGCHMSCTILGNSKAVMRKTTNNLYLWGICILMKRDYPKMNEPSGKELLRPSVWASCELITQSSVNVTWEKSTLIHQFLFWLVVSQAWSKISWFHCCGSEARWNIMAVRALAGRGCSPHGS